MADTKTQEEIDPKMVQRAFRYCPRTGQFWFRERPADWFRSPAVAKSWNARFGGKPVAQTYHQRGYHLLTFRNRKIRAHRAAFACELGHWPYGEVDHINGDPADNRWSNLRVCSHRLNRVNTGGWKNSSSRFVGVSWHRMAGKWMAQYNADGVNHYLGLYDSAMEAARARDAAVRRRFGSWARLNFPEDYDAGN